MEFSLSHLLILLFFLIPLFERFFGKKKAGHKSAPEPEWIEPDYGKDDAVTEMTWEETLQQLETVLSDDVAKPKPAAIPVPVRLDRSYSYESPLRREFVRNEFKSTEPHFRSESLLDTPLVSAAEELTERARHVRVTREALRATIVLNEIMMPPVSRRAHAMNRML